MSDVTPGTEAKQAKLVLKAGTVAGRLTLKTLLSGGYWSCQCSCGNTKIIDGSSIRGGSTRSCGCLRRENQRAFGTRGTIARGQQVHPS